jgi:hypothetical protein
MGGGMYEFRITGCGFDMRFVGDFVASILGVADVVMTLSEEESITELKRYEWILRHRWRIRTYLSDLENRLE